MVYSNDFISQGIMRSVLFTLLFIDSDLTATFGMFADHPHHALFPSTQYLSSILVRFDFKPTEIGDATPNSSLYGHACTASLVH